MYAANAALAAKMKTSSASERMFTILILEWSTAVRAVAAARQGADE